MRYVISIGLAAAIVTFLGRCAQSEDAPPITAGTVLQVMFDDSSAKVQSKGLLQRQSFSDLLKSSKKHLQIAFVIDGTHSMGRDIDGVLNSLTSMAGQLHQQKGGAGNVSFSLVIYRDVQVDPIEFPLDDKFTHSVKELEAAVESVHTQTGKPFFHELVDVGVHDAITKLDWRDPETTSRWIIVFGDAPPYPEGFEDREEEVRREHNMEQLVEAAKEHGIAISGVICMSGFSTADEDDDTELSDTYQKALPDLRNFLDVLCVETGGVTWDLSDPSLRESLIRVAEERRANEQPILKITPEDIEAHKVAEEEGDTDYGNRVRLAVLPHMPLSELTFDPELPAVRVATEMRQKYGLVPGIETSNPTRVSEEVKALRDQGVGDEELLYNLAQSLNVDFVVWGSYDESSEQIRLSSATYKKVDGSKVAEVGESVAKEGETGQKSLVFTVAEKLAANTAGVLSGIDDGMAKTFAQVEKNQDIADAFNAPLSESLRAQREILAGLEALEGALGFNRGDENASSLLELAELKLNSAVAIDSDNPFIHSLLASVYYNQAAIGESEESAKNFIDSLKKAHELRDNAMTEEAKSEIDADYALLVEKDAAKAMQVYADLATSQRPAVARRAHWMLAGILCGDWGADEKVVDVAQAREHMIAILAHHDDSPEGKYFKVALQWDAEEGTRNPKYHKDNNEMMRYASKD